MPSAPPDDPASVSELLEWAGSGYRSRLELAAPFAVVAALSVVLEWSLDLLAWIYDVDRTLTITLDPDVQELALSERVPDVLIPVLDNVMWLFVLAVAGNAALTVVALLVALGTAFLVAEELTERRSRTLARRISIVGGRLPALVAAGLLASLLVTIGLLLLVLPGLYLAVRLGLAAPAIVVDGRGPLDGLRTGWAASADQVATLGGLWLLVVLGAALVGTLSFVGVLLAVLVVLPVFGLGLGRVYLDVRPTDSEP